MHRTVLDTVRVIVYLTETFHWVLSNTNITSITKVMLKTTINVQLFPLKVGFENTMNKYKNCRQINDSKNISTTYSTVYTPWTNWFIILFTNYNFNSIRTLKSDWSWLVMYFLRQIFSTSLYKKKYLRCNLKSKLFH